MLKKILLADSGTGQSVDMLKMLLEIPAFKDASITILHVVSTQLTPTNLTEKWEEGGKILAEAMQALKLDPSTVSTILRQGDPKTVVCQVAEEINTDLIIMGSRGLKRLQSILQNSVSQYVFQLSAKPMLLVKDDIFVKRVNRVMVALDKSPDSAQTLDIAIFLTRDISGGQMILTHAGSAAGAKDFSTNPESDPVLAAAIAKVKPYGIQYRCISNGGKPAETLCQIAEQNQADLIILGSPDRRPSIAKSLPDLDRLLGASVSDYVRVNAPCPVLLARVSDP